MAYADSALRVVVRGLKTDPVQRYDKGIIEEDNLGYFFWDAGCKVDGVRLVIDSKRGNASRGFGFVDFEDQESFQKALDLDGTRAPDIAKDKGCLHIEAARPATDEVRRKQQELLQKRQENEELERALRFQEAKVKELAREVQRKRERQDVLDIAAQLEEENARQDAIRKAHASLEAAEEVLHRSIEIEEERTKAMEAIAVSVDGEQTRPHREQTRPNRSVAPAEEAEPDFNVESVAGSPGEAFVPPPRGRDSLEELTSSAEQLQWRVRNTFIEYYVPQTLDGLVRTKTAPPEFLSSSGHASPKGNDDSPGGANSTFPASSAATHDAASEAVDGCSDEVKKPAGNITRGEERPRWYSLEDDDSSPAPPAPWVLKRETSAAEVSRALLEEKMGGPDRAPPSTSAAAKVGATTEAAASAVSGSVDDGVAVALRAAVPERRLVRLRNVPVLPVEELKAELSKELTRLWRTVRGRPTPFVEEFRTALEPASRTYAQMAAGTDVEIVFADAEDAAWLVDGRQPTAWSRAETLSIRGRVVQVEWVASAPVDWRKLNYTADTDASSHISYGTLGTRQSFSSKIGERVEGARPLPGPRVGQGPGPARPAAVGPPRNRTIVLEGLPTSWPVHQVRDEVLALLKRLWQRDGLKFEPREKLHHGGDGGIDVRPGRKRNEENGGTCLVRLREHLDAKWLVERGRLSVGGGTQLRASWARPRQTGQ